MQRWLVIGARSALGQAVCRAALARGDDYRGLTREPGDDPRLCGWQGDEASLLRGLSQWQDEGYHISHVLICVGQLHGVEFAPEKRIDELDIEALLALMRINAALPVLCLKHLLPIVKNVHANIVVCSARVGSIGDNALGGWYAYRASKAALNMLVQTAAVEYARRAPEVRLMLFQPGTMDSPLSKPFQRGVPAEKLFSPDFVAGCLLKRVEELRQQPAGKAWFVDWQGQTIPW